MPFGALAIWAAGRLREGDGPDRSEKSEFDLPGLVMLAAGLLLVLLYATWGGTDGWGATVCLVPLAAGAVLLAAYGRWAARRAQPALDLSLARQPVAALSMGLCALAAVVTWAAVFLLPVFAQSVQGRSALDQVQAGQHGYRAYVARDPDGYTWTIAQARPGMS